MTSSLGARLRERVTAPGRQPLLLAGAPNALTARVVEEAGFEAVYLSGAGITNTYLGAPDVGLLSLPELAGHVEATRDAVGLPLVVDADTGFGNALGVQRTVRTLERAGANAIQLEDQVSPKRCGHFAGKDVIEADEMIGKIHAAVDARASDDLLIVARTDARAVHGLSAACDRAAAYLEAGADIIFVEAPGSPEELAEITRRVPGPHVANMVEGGLTPILPLERLRELGFAIALYANTAMRGAVAGMRIALRHLKDHGDTTEIGDAIISWADRQNLVRKPLFDALDEKYAGRTTE
ncbi:oxaloacetate decarboxylase [Amycolatopsis sp. NPDC051903]|uniref:oxaloacetate decarboxylase n=1 Tax=Amycolatopsis sp. NPDC051903 TaxID=3363936 RepID=UPI003799D71D